MVYKCAICGEAYEDVKDRASCEMKCIKKLQEEEKGCFGSKKEGRKKFSSARS